MPWPLREDLVLSSFPSYDDVVKRGWGLDDMGVSMITLSKKRPTEETTGLFDQYVYHPIPDGIVTPEREILIWQARDIVLSMMAHHRLTVIHCLAGRSRSGLIGALALQWINNWTGEEAMTYVRQCRPHAVNNPHFEQFLMGLGRPHP